MSENKSFYITTTLPYVNAEPHMGHALEFIRADIIARSKELQGFEVFFNTGTDEHGQKVFAAAHGKDVQSYVDEYAEKFKELLPKLGILENIHFIRTTDPKHIEAAQEFWKRVDKNGYIYKKSYKTKYCIGCEAEKTDSEIENGSCIIHTNLELEEREEENYFFKYSEFSQKLLDFYEKKPNFVIPESRLNEMREFINGGLQDFSISRLKEKMSWGIPVPGDKNHVMYVWFDALTSYISTLGWPNDDETFEKFWANSTPVQYCGKDNTRFQSGMWQAMLMAAGLPNSHKIVVNGFVTGEGGVKMSKSLGNVVNPTQLVDEYGTDALRYFVARELSTFEDTPFTVERFKEAYNANLANGIGNLTSRIMTLAEANLPGPVVSRTVLDMPVELEEALNNFEIQKAMNHIWEEIGELDKEIQDKKPWASKDKEVISDLVIKLYSIARMLNPLLPETSNKIKALIKVNKKPSEPLFLRKD
ncbi:MAG: methionine--tRNA ligase [Candidatus Zambryskibacteria bacterium]|nr:methionine--tRNA ligase [Candidatus Zambryskibacteria bacterium]